METTPPAGITRSTLWLVLGPERRFSATVAFAEPADAPADLTENPPRAPTARAATPAPAARRMKTRRLRFAPPSASLRDSILVKRMLMLSLLWLLCLIDRVNMV